MLEPVLLYGSEYWSVKEQTMKSFDSREMWLLKRMMQIPCTANVINCYCTEKTNESRTLYIVIRKRQVIFSNVPGNEKKHW